jgi:decaprenylphospho-beta-D-ribofuranose 2-oxidase
VSPELLCGWGRTAPSAGRVVYPRSVEQVAQTVRTAGPRGIIARGLGRSYGDAAQNAGGTVLNLSALSHIGAVDDRTGEITVGAGVSVDALLRTVVPHGWFVPVTPGTRWVTIGGAVAADVHGKNHHRDGSIGAHLTAIELVDGLGEPHTVHPDSVAFRAVLGGMGLTGVITSVRLRLTRIGSAYVGVDTTRTNDFDGTLAALRTADRRRFSVAWIDALAAGSGLGRGVVTAGDFLPADATPDPRHPLTYGPGLSVPAPRSSPGRLLDRPLGVAFNQAYYRRAPRAALAVPTSIPAFFHPLDVIRNWNRLYGAHGLVQYQCVSPRAETARAVLELLRDAGAPTLLAVLKRFGPAGCAPLSFPAPGWTLAVDLPARRRELADVLDRADRLVAQDGGRVYLAKDARVRPAVLAEMYPGLAEWRKARDELDPRGTFCSDLARRLEL